jgi:hypothetical protein
MKNLILILVLLISSTVFAQKEVSLQILQFSGLSTGSTRTNDTFTTNFLSSFKMNGKQNKKGFVTAALVFEYANLDEDYIRWSGNIGYNFNKFINDFEIGFYLNYGGINRWGVGFLSYGGITELNYKLNENLKISLVNQITERADLAYRYGNKDLKYSLFFGVELSLN